MGFCLQHAFSKRQNILDTLAQGRYAQGDYVEPVKEIIAEMMRFHLRRQIAIRSSDNAGVNPDSLDTATPSKLCSWTKRRNFV
jgi:hypothetical protein